MFNWIRDLSRGVGHTTSAIGRQTPSTVIVCSTMRQGRELSRRYGVKTASLRQGFNGYFLGRPVPVVFDTDAVQMIVAAYEDKIAELMEAAK